MIQYVVALAIIGSVGGYRMPAFAGMTSRDARDAAGVVRPPAAAAFNERRDPQ